MSMEDEIEIVGNEQTCFHMLACKYEAWNSIVIIVDDYMFPVNFPKGGMIKIWLSDHVLW